MENNRKIALFDFCETLANFQTADAYVKYVISKDYIKIKKGFNYYLQILLFKLKISSVLFHLGININKFLLLNNLKGLNYELLSNEAEKYYKDVIKPNLIKETLFELEKLKKEHYEIVIVSGGYDIYLRYFSYDYKVDHLLCSNLLFKNNIFTGSLDGKDCMGEEKIARIKKSLGLIDLKSCESIAFSDSISDMPLLKFAKKAVVVSRKTKKWAINNNFKTILWER